jgi:PKHD-type hydroxylase
MSGIKTAPVVIGGYKVVVWKDVFTPAELDKIVALGDGLAPMRAQLEYGKDAANHVRITRVAWIDPGPDTTWLYARLEEVILRMNQDIFHFELYGLEPGLQYTVYESAESGHYNWHVDAGQHNPEPRKISLSLQLSDPADYEGGRLVIEAGDGAYPAETARGTIIAFPSYVLHRVTPTESGVRKSLVIWVTGPEFR